MKRTVPVPGDDNPDFLSRWSEPAIQLAWQDGYIHGSEAAHDAMDWLLEDNERMRDAVRDLFRAWCGDEPIWDEHGIDEGFGGLIVHAAMVADVYGTVKRERYDGGAV